MTLDKPGLYTPEVLGFLVQGKLGLVSILHSWTEQICKRVVVTHTLTLYYCEYNSLSQLKSHSTFDL